MLKNEIMRGGEGAGRRKTGRETTKQRIGEIKRVRGKKGSKAERALALSNNTGI